MDNKDLFYQYLTTCVKSTRSTQNNPLFLGGNAPKDYCRFLESDRLFDYDSSLWVGVNMYDIDDCKVAEQIFYKLYNDERFLKRNEENNQGWRLGAISHYVCFLKAKTLFSTGNLSNNKSNNPVFSVDMPLQQIYYGAPGTGKSHTLNAITEGYTTIRTTFHPDSDYSTFVGCYKPTTRTVVLRDLSGHRVKEDGKEVTEDKIVYEFVPQAFVQAYVEAWKDTSKPVFLVIEEINRGNCAQIFGDLFQLLDRDNDGFSSYPIKPDQDLGKFIAKQFKDLEIDSETVKSGNILLLPSNLYIWATMNTSDQSLFPIDSAFKRRWDWKYVPISQGRNEDGSLIDWSIVVNGNKYDWWSFLQKINEKVGDTTNSEDKKLGFFFCKAINGEISAETFVGKVVFYLWNDVFKDYGFEDAIFRDEDGKLAFDKFYWVDATGNTVVEEDKVEKFLTNLGLEPVSDDEEEEYDEDDYEDDDDESDELFSSDTNSPTKVKFPDGTVIKEGNGFDTFVASLRKIGLNRVLQFGDKYTRLNKTLPLITDRRIKSEGHYKYVEVDGYYILSGTDSQHRLLSYINKQLNLGLKIY